MMVRVLALLSFVALALLAQQSSPAQTTGTASLFFDAVPFAGSSPDTARLDLYLTVPYNAITYERRGETFHGRYRANIRVEGGDRVWYDSSFERSLRTRSYEVTTGEVSSLEFYQLQVALPPGTYSARVDVVDLRTNLSTTLVRPATVGTYSTPGLALSGLLSVTKIREDSGRFVITPALREPIPGEGGGYFLFFEAYNGGGAIDAVVRAAYRDNARSVGSAVIVTRQLPPGTSQQWIHMPADAMPRGTFVVEVRVCSAADTAQVLATAQRTVKLEGTAMAMAMADEELDSRVSQLRYVAAQSDIDHIRAGLTLGERGKRFADFWARLDPTPATVANEAMDEYYRRIDYAEAHFRSYAAGWLTDKGRVHVIFGTPDNIINDPFRSDGKAVETWQYQRRNIRVTFIDESGFGDFRLVTPLPAGEKYRYGA